jgi:hypothetical protein
MSFEGLEPAESQRCPEMEVSDSNSQHGVRRAVAGPKEPRKTGNQEGGHFMKRGVGFGAMMLFLMFTWGAAFAADCGEPVSAPQYQVGEKWTWRNEKGREWTDQVLQVNEGLTQIKWSNGEVGFYDKDRVLRQVKKTNGELVTQQGAGQYVAIGQKTLDFPLQAGKTWNYSFYGQPRGGGTGLQTYRNEFKVIGCEELSIPAGKVSALKLEITQWIVGTHWNGVFYLWYAPQVKSYVKRQYPVSTFFSGGWFLDYELIKYEPK